MGKVITQASMPLDGYIADLSDNVGLLFDWSTTGDVEVTGSDPNMVLPASQHRALTYARVGEHSSLGDRPPSFRSGQRVGRPPACGGGRVRGDSPGAD